MILTACIAQASDAYTIPVPAIEQVIAGAHGRGIGPMGIPAEWMPILERIGFTSSQVHSDPCKNIAAGTWIMAYEKLAGHGSGGATAPSSPPPPALPGSATADSRPAGGVTAACVKQAAQAYNLPVMLLQGVLATEGGHVGEIHRNANGSYDMGPAQVNSTWLPKLAAQGITREEVINDGCLNVHIGAWILAQAMKGADPNQPGQFWQHVGAYNSMTPRYNQRYAALVWNHVTELSENQSR
ncbi:MAG: transglycosylase SLT domain-containing protein [Betaproteobacteria bacterium]|nr:transglycosylase SLT domain-containing protein [Betaproteobacteria bacterium]